ncbi:MAG: sodium:proton antiporter, partial [Pirellulales bacterium]
TKADRQRDVTQVRRLRFHGIRLNGLLLLGVVVSVALLAPTKTFPGTDWHPWMYLREIVQILLVAISLWFGKKEIRVQNMFNYHAIVEVAALFCGIFICMQPALDILRVAGPNLGIDTPTKFFWVTGGLSSVLDNAPTYVVFFETAKAVSGHSSTLVAGVAQEYLVPVSLGAVFMGAMTYIGNGPNFMVKAIAEKSGIPMPSFFGYILFYSVPVLLPILIVVTLVFV